MENKLNHLLSDDLRGLILGMTGKSGSEQTTFCPSSIIRMAWVMTTAIVSSVERRFVSCAATSAEAVCPATKSKEQQVQMHWNTLCTWLESSVKQSYANLRSYKRAYFTLP